MREGSISTGYHRKNGIDTIICPNIEGTYQQIKEECKKINCVKHFYHISDLLVEKV